MPSSRLGVITFKSYDCVAPPADGDESQPGQDAEARSEGENHSTPILLQDTNLDKVTLLFPADYDSNVSLSLIVGGNFVSSLHSYHCCEISTC